MNIISQLKSNRSKILIILVISGFLVGLVILLNTWKGIPISHMTRDITAAASIPPYTGFFSQIGFVLWIVTATLCIFSAYISPKRQGNRMFIRFLYFFGLLSLLLCFDDMFLLHETVIPYFFDISENVTFAFYGVFVISLLLKFYSIILKTDYILLAMAFIFFGLSIAVDTINIRIPGLNSLILEDGAKMFGIVSWLTYFYSNALVIVSISTESLQNN